MYLYFLTASLLLLLLFVGVCRMLEFWPVQRTRQVLHVRVWAGRAAAARPALPLWLTHTSTWGKILKNYLKLMESDQKHAETWGALALVRRNHINSFPVWMGPGQCPWEWWKLTGHPQVVLAEDAEDRVPSRGQRPEWPRSLEREAKSWVGEHRRAAVLPEPPADLWPHSPGVDFRRLSLNRRDCTEIPAVATRGETAFGAWEQPSSLPVTQTKNVSEEQNGIHSVYDAWPTMSRIHSNCIGHVMRPTQRKRWAVENAPRPPRCS